MMDRSTSIRRLLLMGLAGLSVLGVHVADAGPRPRWASGGPATTAWPSAHGPHARGPWLPRWGPGPGAPAPLAVVLPDPGPAHAAELDAAIARLGHLLREAEARDGARQP